MGFKLQDHTEPQPRIAPVRNTGNFDEVLKAWQGELDGYYEEMQQFGEMPPDEIFRNLSAFSSRMNAIRTVICRTDNKRWSNFRTKEIEPFVSECDRQFKIWSRNLTNYTLDWEMSKGY